MDTIRQTLGDYLPEILQVLAAALAVWLMVWRFRRSTGMRAFLTVAAMVLGSLVVCAMLDLRILAAVIRVVGFFAFIILIVVHQPELRRIVSEIGSRGFLFLGEKQREFIEQLEEAVRVLSAKRIGALIALERRADLDSTLETGVTLDAKFGKELLQTIFHPRTALHDGGMIVRDGRVRGAGCIFPVSQREFVDRSTGLRHRAGVGITEESDAVAVVVSEETGEISICHGGVLERALGKDEFHNRLTELLVGEPDAPADGGDHADDKDATKAASAESRGLADGDPA